MFFQSTHWIQELISYIGLMGKSLNLVSVEGCLYNNGCLTIRVQ